MAGRIPDVALDPYLSKGLLADAKTALGHVAVRPHLAPRLFHVPAIEFQEAIARLGRSGCPDVARPYQPTVLGLPVAPYVGPTIRLVAVADDHTNLAQEGRAQREVH